MVALKEKSGKSKIESSQHVGRKRRDLDPKSTDIRIRWGIKLRSICDQMDLMTGKDLASHLTAKGLDVAVNSGEKWLAGDVIPDVGTIEQIAAILIPGHDYRELIPDPATTTKKRRT